jgi:nucleoid-associated protein YgaU
VVKPQKMRVQRVLPNGTFGPAMQVQFNPGEYTLAKGNQIAEVPIPGLDSPILQFVRGLTETLALELFFDTTEEGTGVGATSVTTKTDPFYDLIKIESKTHAPPVLWLTWGATRFPGGIRDGFQCVVESVRQRYTLFDPTGVPLRAVVSLTLREYKSLAQQINELNLQSADHTKAHVFAEGETLSGVAYAEYGDPGQWRVIAEANGVDDPAAVPAGRVLSIPRTLP